jgi:hypothetical protein
VPPKPCSMVESYPDGKTESPVCIWALLITTCVRVGEVGSSWCNMGWSDSLRRDCVRFKYDYAYEAKHMCSLVCSRYSNMAAFIISLSNSQSAVFLRCASHLKESGDTEAALRDLQWGKVLCLNLIIE